MKEFLKKNQDLLLAAAVVMILGVIASVFIWGVIVISVNVDKAISVPANKNSQMNFNFEDAKKLDLRGLIQ